MSSRTRGWATLATVGILFTLAPASAGAVTPQLVSPPDGATFNHGDDIEFLVQMGERFKGPFVRAATRPDLNPDGILASAYYFLGSAPMMTYADATETLYKGRLDGRHFRALNPPGTYYWQAANVDSLGGPPGTYDTTPVRSFTVVPKAAPAPVAPRTANPVRSTECRNALNKRDFMNGAVRRAKSNLARARAARSKRIQRSLLRSRYRQLRYAKMRVNAFC